MLIFLIIILLMEYAAGFSIFMSLVHEIILIPFVFVLHNEFDIIAY